MSNYTLDSFLEKLVSVKPNSEKKKTFENKKLIQRIYCNFKGNFGKYQILPFTSAVSDFPYVPLMGTREISIPRRNIAADGTESKYDAWIRILPISGYSIKDPSSGREVSSLTAADEQLLRRAYMVWDELYNELDGKNNALDPTVSRLIRRKNYTIFHGYCINMFAEGEPRKPAKQNFSGLFILTAKNFLDIVNSNIVDTNIMMGSTNGEWINGIYNQDVAGRKGFMMLSVSDNPSGPGFNISVTHQVNPEFLQGVQIPEEEAAEMLNPVETFLGWQARKDDEEVPAGQRNLFNAKLIQESIDFMTDQLTRIRLAKQNNTSIEEAIRMTNELTLQNQNPTDSRGNQTVDPVLIELANKEAGNSGVSKEQQGTYGNQNIGTPEVVEKNVNPFANPAASHQDPVTGGAAPFKPSFGGGGMDSAVPF